MTKNKALVFRLVGVGLAVVAIVVAFVSFDALGAMSILAFAMALASLVFLKIANNFNRNLLGNLSFLVAFAIMIFTVISIISFFACGV